MNPRFYNKRLLTSSSHFCWGCGKLDCRDSSADLNGMSNALRLKRGVITRYFEQHTYYDLSDLILFCKSGFSKSAKKFSQRHN